MKLNHLLFLVLFSFIFLVLISLSFGVVSAAQCIGTTARTDSSRTFPSLPVPDYCLHYCLSSGYDCGEATLSDGSRQCVCNIPCTGCGGSGSSGSCQGDTMIMGCDVSTSQTSCEQTCSPELNTACVWNGTRCVADENYCDVPCWSVSGSSGSSGDTGQAGSNGGGGESGFGDQSIRVKMYLDPGYIAKTEAERGFRPSEPFTPFDDVICELNITHSSDYSSRTFQGKLITQDNSEVVNGILSYSYTQGSRDYYSWKISGWKNGWTNNSAVMEKIINDKKIGCYVKISGTTSGAYTNTVSREAEYLVGTCVHLQGKNDAKFKIVSLRTKSLKFTIKQIVDLGEKLRTGGFGAFSPFKENQNEFSHFSCLEEVDDSQLNFAKVFVDFQLVEVPIFEKITEKKITTRFDAVINGKPYYFFYNNKGYLAYVMKVGGRVMFINLPSANGWTRTVKANENTFQMHEFGHAFCKLADEYFIPSQSGIAGLILVNGVMPEDFVPVNSGGQIIKRNCRLLGDFGDFGTSISGCTRSLVKRSSDTSIMNQLVGSDLRFNVISAGYCLNAIKGGDINDNFKEACTMDTIRPSGNPTCT